MAIEILETVLVVHYAEFHKGKVNAARIQVREQDAGKSYDFFYSTDGEEIIPHGSHAVIARHVAKVMEVFTALVASIEVYEKHYGRNVQ